MWALHSENKPQSDAYYSLADELLYGGSAGGGKTDLLLGLGFTQHKKTALFRKQQRDAKSIIDRGKEINDEYGKWHAQERVFKTGDGREIEICHCSAPGDEESQQGRPRDLYGFDELTQFTKAQYLFITGWNRSSDPDQRCRIVNASNPPLAAEAYWVIERWAPWLDPNHPNPAVSGELRWHATLDGVDTELDNGDPFEFTDETGFTDIIQPRSRTFIPARLEDNPYYKNSGYRAVLQGLPEPLRTALLTGNFTAAMEDDPWQAIPTDWIMQAQARWTPKPPDRAPMDAMGVDPARGGRDKLTMIARHGDWFSECWSVPGNEVPTGVLAAGHVINHIRDGAPAHVDTIGIGAACYEHLDGAGVPVVSMVASEKSTERDKSGQLGFKNKRAQWHWNMREALDPDTGDDLALPPDAELRADLAAAHWEPTPNGIKVESKEDIYDRLKRSTDKGDACIMALPTLKLPIRKGGGKRVGSTPAPAAAEDSRRS